MKHGPIALIDEAVPVIVLAPSGPLFEKTVSNMQEVRARGGKIVLISDAKGLAEAGEGCMATIEMPKVHPLIAPSVYACRCSCSPTMWRSPRARTSTSRATSRRASLSSERAAMKHIGILAHSFEAPYASARPAWRASRSSGRTCILSHVTCVGPWRWSSMPGSAGTVTHSFAASSLEDAKKLAGAAGADFFVLPDNTAHIAMERPAIRSRFPDCTSPRSSPNRRREMPPKDRYPRHEIYDERAGLSGCARTPRDRLGGSLRRRPAS